MDVLGLRYVLVELVLLRLRPLRGAVEWCSLRPPSNAGVASALADLLRRVPSGGSIAMECSCVSGPWCRWQGGGRPEGSLMPPVGCWKACRCSWSTFVLVVLVGVEIVMDVEAANGLLYPCGLPIALLLV